MTPARRIIGVAAAALVLSASVETRVLAHPGIDEQIAHVNELLAAQPDSATLYVRRGELNRVHQDWPAAEADFLKALALDPDIAVAEMCLGRLKLETGKPEEAKPYLDRYLQKRPTDTEALATRGRVLVALGQPLAGAEDLSRSIESGNREPRPEQYLERAHALEAAGPEYLPRAIQGLDEGRARLGDPVTLQLLAVDLELERGGYDAALKRIDELAKQSVRQEPWLIRRATILEAAGRRAEAKDSYQQALAAIETLPSARRGTKAVAQLESEARAAIQRLDAAPTAQ